MVDAKKLEKIFHAIFPLLSKGNCMLRTLRDGAYKVLPKPITFFVSFVHFKHKGDLRKPCCHTTTNQRSKIVYNFSKQLWFGAFTIWIIPAQIKTAQLYLHVTKMFKIVIYLCD
jgi:hypothetical protein